MAFDAYLKIDSVPGEATDSNHQGWISLLSFHHGIVQPHAKAGSGGGSRGAIERCEHQDFVITKEIDKASPKLNLFCCNGQNLKEVKLEVLRQVDTKLAYMTYIFRTCLIRSVVVHANPMSSDKKPIEEVNFSYAEIEWKYTEVDPTGNTSAGDTMARWNLLDNTGG